MNECEPQARVQRYGEKTISNRGGSSGSNTGTKSLEPVSVVFKRIISSCLALKIECVCVRERERELFLLLFVGLGNGYAQEHIPHVFREQSNNGASRWCKGGSLESSEAEYKH